MKSFRKIILEVCERENVSVYFCDKVKEGYKLKMLKSEDKKDLIEKLNEVGEVYKVKNSSLGGRFGTFECISVFVRSKK